MTGTVFNADKEQGDWFSFFESEINLKTGDVEYHDPVEGAGRACIRPMAPFWESRQAQKEKKSEFVLNPKTRAMERVEYFKEQTAQEEIEERNDAFDYGIIEFENFYDGKGSLYECTRENKLWLIHIPVFDRFIARCFELQQNAKTARTEALEKN